MKTVVICGGGPEAELIDFSSLQSEQAAFIGADYGAIHLVNKGIVPVLAIGDFDSVSDVNWEKLQELSIELKKVSAEKDETDLELALEASLKWHPTNIIVTGVTGGRLDHFYSAIQAVLAWKEVNQQVDVSIQNKLNSMEILLPGDHNISVDKHYPYISFFPLRQTIHGFTLKGFKYNVENNSIHFGETKYTSNELIDKNATISISSGICLMIRSHD
ncbi:thiamine diphosphokinase [Paenisporosarcina cavernae]|uniref:Thiamine diphosphokinase n=1 Tax=Paenisporosarcina cavernae TaxID=2320858 RepID=A0A385YRT8_9BACL|nr:thiamine diphosphokinase [Paenisporosarcina cavernae]AYC29201.1 thiamine diphosphokinase [Paenisporosarcina cavernae]